MSAFKNDDDFNERLSTAAKAKQALLEKFRVRPKADDPAAAERHAARLATSLARDARIAERKAAREAEAARLQAEAIRQAAEDAARQRCGSGTVPACFRWTIGALFSRPKREKPC